MKTIFGATPIRWKPTREHFVTVLMIGFSALGYYLDTKDRLSSVLAIGIVFGLGIAHFIYKPPTVRRQVMKGSGNPSVLKTVVFWGMMLVLSILIYQLFRGPVH